MKTKQGSLASLGALFVVALGILLSSVMATLLLQQFQQFDMFTTGLPGVILSQGLSMMSVVDDIFLFVVGTFFTLIILQSFRTKMHPIWGIVGVFGLSGLVIVSGMIANIANFFVNMSLVSSAANLFGNMVAFFTNLPTITAVFGAIIILVMVAGGRLTGSGGGGV